MPVNSKFLVVKTKDSKEIKYFDYDNIMREALIVGNPI